LFSNIRIVLVETTHPGNIGAVARAMKNMGLHDMRLVSPKIFPSAEATSRASGAADLLSDAVVCESLDEALVGCDLVMGASARRRTISWPELSSHEGAKRAAEAAQTGKVAILFGRENSGLTNEELDRCQYLIHIPCNPDFSSLNIGAAVQVITYELRMALSAGDGAVKIAKKSEDRPSTADELEAFFQHLEQTLYDIGFTEPERSRSLVRRLKRLYNRAGMEKKEVDILRGIFSMMKEKKERNRSGQ
jgi:TrmH family RNA methyltransferase